MKNNKRKTGLKCVEACMDELQKCSKSPYYFATNYISIERNGETVPFRTDLTEGQFNGMFRELVEDSRKKHNKDV